MIESALGNYEEAAQHYARSYALREEFDDPSGMALTSMHLAEIALQQQRWEEASDRYEHSLKSYYETNDRGGLAAAHEGLGRIAAAQGNSAEAQRHLHMALHTASQIGFVPVLLSTLTSVAEFLLQTNRQELATTVLQVVTRHRSVNANTRRRAAQLLAAHGSDMAVEGAAGESEESQEVFNALVTRLLVELAIQQW
jgi:tetratricopeptide (TPR) repeat protein